jgi:hypothetical protein
MWVEPDGVYDRIDPLLDRLSSLLVPQVQMEVADVVTMVLSFSSIP